MTDNPKVCVVTCTGGRPELFALCRRWVERQTYKPSAWIVTTDLPDTPDIPDWATLVRVPKYPLEVEHIPVGIAMWALFVALRNVPKDHAVVIMEDDDWYSPDHIAKAVCQLREAPIVQLGLLWRFHLPEARAAKGRPGNPDQSHLVPGIASFRHDQIGLVSRTIRAGLTWELPIRFYDGKSCVSIKGVGHGLPGRAGATTKHQRDHRKTKRAEPDPGHAKFRRRLGADAEDYLRLLQHEPSSATRVL